MRTNHFRSSICRNRVAKTLHRFRRHRLHGLRMTSRESHQVEVKRWSLTSPIQPSTPYNHSHSGSGCSSVTAALTTGLRHPFHFTQRLFGIAPDGDAPECRFGQQVNARAWGGRSEGLQPEAACKLDSLSAETLRRSSCEAALFQIGLSIMTERLMRNEQELAASTGHDLRFDRGTNCPEGLSRGLAQSSRSLP